MRQRGVIGLGREPGDQPALRREPHLTLTPATRGALELADRQGVEKLVRDKEQGRVIRQVFDLRVPDERAPGQRLALHVAQGRRGLDQMDFGGLDHPRHRRHRAQHIGHQRAAPGPRLGQDEPRGPPLIEPDLREAKPQHLAEHLRDFRRGDEIARRPERVARRVIAMLGMQQALGHEMIEPHRPFGRDTPREDLGQRRHGAASPRLGRRIARQANHSPTRIIGIDRICPMVSPAPPNCST